MAYFVNSRPRGLLCFLIASVTLISIATWCKGTESLDYSKDTLLRKSIPLEDGWKFHLGEATSDVSRVLFDDSGWDKVALPHTWNAFDGQDGGNNYYRGSGWYRKHFKLNTEINAGHVFLECDGASREAEVFINGKLVGKHTGAFARFRFDITNYLVSNGDNLVAIRVDNSKSDMIPLGGDYTQCGGLYRKVRLVLTAPVHIATLDYGSSGVYLAQHAISAERADIAARIKVTNETTKRVNATVQVSIQSKEHKVVARISDNKLLTGNSTSEVTVPLTVKNPHLWNGLSDPYLYTAYVEVVIDGHVVDRVVEPLGLRYYQVNPDTGFYLNGSRYELHGVNRHQDRFDKGWAISEENQIEDFKLMSELGANVVRLVHYQHDQCFYYLCDEGGVAVWAELCFSKSPPKTDAGLANAKEQLKELIRQNYNHPAILFWSIGNETTEQNGVANNLLKELAELVKQEDPTRLSVYASHHAPEDPRNFHSDILAVNKYFGWYHGTYSDLGVWLDAFHKAYPTRSFGISEYGAGASIYQHEDNPPVRNSQSRGLWHPEEWQSRFHEENWLQIKQRPYLWGTFVWVLFDLASDGRNDGDRPGINDKGLVTQDRQIRKDAFYWYQANWTSKPMVHIASKRYTDRTIPTTDIRIYSNATEVDIICNGVDLGSKSSRDRRFIWPNFVLQLGLNRIQAIAYQESKIVATDDACWTYRKIGDKVPVIVDLNKE